MKQARRRCASPRAPGSSAAGGMRIAPKLRPALQTARAWEPAASEQKRGPAPLGLPRDTPRNTCPEASAARTQYGKHTHTMGAPWVCAAATRPRASAAVTSGRPVARAASASRSAAAGPHVSLPPGRAPAGPAPACSIARSSAAQHACRGTATALQPLGPGFRAGAGSGPRSAPAAPRAASRAAPGAGWPAGLAAAPAPTAAGACAAAAPAPAGGSLASSSAPSQPSRVWLPARAASDPKAGSSTPSSPRSSSPPSHPSPPAPPALAGRGGAPPPAASPPSAGCCRPGSGVAGPPAASPSSSSSSSPSLPQPSPASGAWPRAAG